MKLPVTVRIAARIILGRRIVRYVRHVGVPKVRDLNAYRNPVAGKRALEIGGPSEIFDYDGSVPIYPILGSVDNCLFSSETIWTGKVDGRFHYNAGKRNGIQYISEATRLEPIVDASYECVLASHCLEHIANPLKALKEFQRVLKPGGLLLVILPHKDNTFDWRRPLTSLNHLENDYAKDVAEDDTTHLSEVIELHDLTRDIFPGTKEQFRERCLQNHRFRLVHHHTFDMPSAVAFIEYAGFLIVQVETVKPYHIVILSQLRSVSDS